MYGIYVDPYKWVAFCLRNDLCCVRWGIKLYSLTPKFWGFHRPFASTKVCRFVTAAAVCISGLESSA